ncbi:hypothetical protein PYCCODRAFT_620811 [Trametes coccinea BRFM310]|uniref:Uncharacterized protein n=1 Tax=Trametes coccinea (strain BRFM310) TaxID=1353009 RepID=A0A1Y2J272_TRAC3|nr:hypothetical protein PYCCODRAFT_620811 [Trametes coccinea BRFM310]
MRARRAEARFCVARLPAGILSEMVRSAARSAASPGAYCPHNRTQTRRQCIFPIAARQAGREGAFPCGRTLQKPSIGSSPPAPRNEGPAVALIIHTPVSTASGSVRAHAHASEIEPPLSRYSCRPCPPPNQMVPSCTRAVPGATGVSGGLSGSSARTGGPLLVIGHVQYAARIALLRHGCCAGSGSIMRRCSDIFHRRWGELAIGIGLRGDEPISGVASSQGHSPGTLNVGVRQPG